MTIKITDTTMRDGHQSLLATRMRTEDMLPISPEMDDAGFHSVEVWGGATFDTALRFLREDPWERLRELKKRFKKTPLQMLLRGQNVVGYRHYADDVVEKFCQLAVKNGMAEMSYIKAVEAGLDIIDCALSTLSQGTSQPPTESLVATFEGTEHDPKLDLEQLAHLADYFGEVRKKYAAFEGNVKVDSGVLIHQVPGGMISNLVSQLREMGAADRLKEVLEEIPRVRADMGYPPLVTPTSQIVGSQAVLNVVRGERYKQVSKETRAVVLGQYGQTPAPIPDDVRKKIAADVKPITERPADQLKPELENAKAEIGPLAHSVEDVLSYVLFPPVAREFFEWRESGSHLEPEVVAAIAAALSQDHRHAAPAHDGAGGVQAQNAWKIAGRRRLMRS